MTVYKQSNICQILGNSNQSQMIYDTSISLKLLFPEICSCPMTVRGDHPLIVTLNECIISRKKISASYLHTAQHNTPSVKPCLLVPHFCNHFNECYAMAVLG